jgi:hypothetical protein
VSFFFQRDYNPVGKQMSKCANRYGILNTVVMVNAQSLRMYGKGNELDLRYKHSGSSIYSFNNN